MAIHIVLLIVGLIIVWAGAEGFIRGGSATAEAAGISPLIIGLSFGAAATSLPELSVSWIASFSGASAMALGNAAGSNIANTGLALGLGAVIYPLAAEREILRNDFWFLLAAGILFYLFTANMVMTRLEGGGVLVMGFFIYMLHIIKRHAVSGRGSSGECTSIKRPALFFAAGAAGLILGGRLVVTGASALASSWGISQTAVGLSIVALGTTLPEISVLVAGGIRKAPGISLGTIVGSNIFNILLVAGGSALIRPAVLSPGREMFFQAPAVVVFTVLLLPLMAGTKKIGRLRGTLLLLCYFAYMKALFTGWT